MKQWIRRAILASSALAMTMVGLTFLKAQDESPGDIPGLLPNHQGEKTIVTDIVDRGGTRVVTLQFYSSNTAPYNFTAESEIDVSTMVVANGSWTSGSYAEGGFFILTEMNDGLLSYSLDGYGTKSMDFPEPLKLREGDKVAFLLKQVQTFGGTVTLTLIGRAPQSRAIILR